MLHIYQLIAHFRKFKYNYLYGHQIQFYILWQIIIQAFDFCILYLLFIIIYYLLFIFIFSSFIIFVCV